jgi:hypothetical protein
MWAQPKPPLLPQKGGCSRPSPYERDVGRVIRTRWGEFGRENYEGGPMKWEARLVRHETRTTTTVLVRFRHLSSHFLPVDVCNPAARLKRHPNAAKTPRNHDDTPTLQQRPNNTTTPIAKRCWEPELAAGRPYPTQPGELPPR